MLLTEFCPGSDLLRYCRYRTDIGYRCYRTPSSLIFTIASFSHLAKYGKETDVREKAIYLYEVPHSQAIVTLNYRAPSFEADYRILTTVS